MTAPPFLASQPLRSVKSVAAVQGSVQHDLDAGSNSSSRSKRSIRSNRGRVRDAAYRVLVFEAKKRSGLSVLNYMITSNHVHLFVKDTGPNVIADSMQLIAGRTAQEYNQGKDRQGAFWEDRHGRREKRRLFRA